MRRRIIVELDACLVIVLIRGHSVEVLRRLGERLFQSPPRLGGHAMSIAGVA